MSKFHSTPQSIVGNRVYIKHRSFLLYVNLPCISFHIFSQLKLNNKNCYPAWPAAINNLSHFIPKLNTVASAPGVITSI